MEEGGPLVDCSVHQIDLARWWLDSEVRWQQGLGVWLDTYEAPDHVFLHTGHECGAHAMIEVSFSYNTTSLEPRTHFLYELIGTDGGIRATRIAKTATQEAIRNQDAPSRECPSTKIQATDVRPIPGEISLDTLDLPLLQIYPD